MSLLISGFHWNTRLASQAGQKCGTSPPSFLFLHKRRIHASALRLSVVRSVLAGELPVFPGVIQRGP